MANHSKFLLYFLALAFLNCSVLYSQTEVTRAEVKNSISTEQVRSLIEDLNPHDPENSTESINAAANELARDYDERGTRIVLSEIQTALKTDLDPKINGFLNKIVGAMKYRIRDGATREDRMVSKILLELKTEEILADIKEKFGPKPIEAISQLKNLGAEFKFVENHFEDWPRIRLL